MVPPTFIVIEPVSVVTFSWGAKKYLQLHQETRVKSWGAELEIKRNSGPIIDINSERIETFLTTAGAGECLSFYWCWDSGDVVMMPPLGRVNIWGGME